MDTFNLNKEFNVHLAKEALKIRHKFLCCHQTQEKIVLKRKKLFHAPFLCGIFSHPFQLPPGSHHLSVGSEDARY